MEKTELTVSIEPERLDALNYFLSQDGSSAQKELEKMLAELYERKVPEDTRGYIESKIAPTKPKRPSHTAPKPKATPPASHHNEPKKEEHHEQ